MNLVIGVERGWISREDAANHIVKIVRFLKTADRFAGAWHIGTDPTAKLSPSETRMRPEKLWKQLS